MLDMHNIVDAIHVSAGASLELVNITVRPHYCTAIEPRLSPKWCQESSVAQHVHMTAIPALSSVFIAACQFRP